MAPFTLPLKVMIPLLTILILFGAWVLYGYLSIRSVEEPHFTVLEPKDGGAIARASHSEIRKYDPTIVAETTVPGPYDKAVNNGFRAIADYIFGNNKAEAPIAMTTPVLQEESTSEPIAMTTPVLQEETDSNEFVISFVMPSQYSMETIPKPNNPQVTLREVPARTLGVVTFSGLWTDAKAKKYTEMLRKDLEEDGYTILSAPQFARYNPPWTPPWMRRNEIWFEIQ